MLLIHGTAGTPEAWSWNYLKALPAEGYDVCTVALPDFAREDIQVSTEYVVHAIRVMAERSGGKVDVIGFSQGPMESRWAVKYWPDVRAVVDDLVLAAAPNHGFSLTEMFCAQDCIAPFWQMKPESRFLASLNAGDETPGDISYTSVYTRTDNAVQPAFPGDGTAGLDGASNIGLQDLCPGRPIEHFQMLYDAVAYAVVLDALSHPGPADASRVDRGGCGQVARPGVDTAAAAVKVLELYRDFSTRTQEHHTPSEPALASYAGS